jgi:hypothetical protein
MEFEAKSWPRRHGDHSIANRRNVCDHIAIPGLVIGADGFLDKRVGGIE